MQMFRLGASLGLKYAFVASISGLGGPPFQLHWCQTGRVRGDWLEVGRPCHGVGIIKVTVVDLGVNVRANEGISGR
jgi:hypothetical protein